MSVDLSGLNPEQRAAVEHTEGPLLVLAGAGSGKTRVITFRIAHLLAQGVTPERILALSFTNKAATEMRERLVSLTGEAGRRCHASTFHALGVRFIKLEYEAAGLRPKFSILDEADQLDAVKQALAQLRLDPDRYAPEGLLSQIGHFKSQLLNPASVGGARVAAMCFEAYQRRLRLMNAVDFDDLIRTPVVLMESNKALREKWGRRYHYIMVDEYQDTNGAQLRMLKALAGNRNLCVVGDDDQSIYGFRGAVASNILRFGEQFEGARTIALTQNYRSTNLILRAANHVIAHNTERHVKELWSAHGEGEPLRYRLLEHGDEEAEWVAKELIRLKHAKGLAWSDIAILYRTNQQSRAFEEAVRHLNVPYRVVGGTKFYDRKEIKDALAYLRLLVNPTDENALRRIINTPSRGIGDNTIERLAHTSLTTGVSMWRLCDEVGRVEGLSAQARSAVRGFYEMLQPFIEPLNTPLHTLNVRPWGELFLELMAVVRFKEGLIKQYRDAAQVEKRWANLEEMANSLTWAQSRGQDEDLSAYLNRVALDYPKEGDDEVKDEVSLMSLHSSKGLEFHTVFFVGFEEGWLPHERVLEESFGEVDEERRLAYVGITRAKRSLTLTGAKKRLSFGKLKRRKPSRFLDEIPEELFEGGEGRGKLGGPTRDEAPTQEEERAAAEERNAAIDAMLATLKS
jgi:superfamily I DNA/RNA helicase